MCKQILSKKNIASMYTILESSWRNSHVLVYHVPLQIATFWGLRHLRTHYGVNVYYSKVKPQSTPTPSRFHTFFAANFQGTEFTWKLQALVQQSPSKWHPKFSKCFKKFLKHNEQHTLDVKFGSLGLLLSTVDVFFGGGLRCPFLHWPPPNASGWSVAVQ